MHVGGNENAMQCGCFQKENAHVGVVNERMRTVNEFPADFGRLSCGGYPGSGGNLELDMQVGLRERERERERVCERERERERGREIERGERERGGGGREG